MRIMIAACVAGLCAGWASLGHGASGPSLSAELDNRNAYVWRGQILSKETVMQPSITAQSGALSVNLWGNLDLGDGEGRITAFSELDFTASYSATVGPADWELGFIEYAFPGAAIEDTREIFGKAGVTPTSGIELSLAAFVDVGEADGFYSIATVRQAVVVNRTTTLLLEAGTAWANERYHAFYFGVDASALGDAGVGVALEHDFDGGLSATTGLQYAWFWDSRIHDAAQTAYGSSSKIGLRVDVSKHW